MERETTLKKMTKTTAKINVYGKHFQKCKKTSEKILSSMADIIKEIIEVLDKAESKTSHNPAAEYKPMV